MPYLRTSSDAYWIWPFRRAIAGIWRRPTGTSTPRASTRTPAEPVMNMSKLQADLVRDEDEVLHAYADHRGYLTLGVGRLIDKRRGGGITHDEALYLLGNDITRVTDELSRRIRCWPELNGVRQRALANMAFQLGVNGLLRFRRMWRAIEAGLWAAAYDEALDSNWARQTPARARRVAQMILTGRDVQDP